MWTVPDFDVDYPVISYLLKYKEVSQSKWKQLKLDVPSASSVVVTGLEEGTEYELRLAAVNSIGIGPFCRMMETCKTLGKYTRFLNANNSPLTKNN